MTRAACILRAPGHGFVSLTVSNTLGFSEMQTQTTKQAQVIPEEILGLVGGDRRGLNCEAVASMDSFARAMKMEVTNLRSNGTGPFARILRPSPNPILV